MLVACSSFMHKLPGHPRARGAPPPEGRSRPALIASWRDGLGDRHVSIRMQSSVSLFFEVENRIIWSGHCRGSEERWHTLNLLLQFSLFKNALFLAASVNKIIRLFINSKIFISISIK